MFGADTNGAPSTQPVRGTQQTKAVPQVEKKPAANCHEHADPRSLANKKQLQGDSLALKRPSDADGVIPANTVVEGKNALKPMKDVSDQLPLDHIDAAADVPLSRPIDILEPNFHCARRLDGCRGAAAEGAALMEAVLAHHGSPAPNIDMQQPCDALRREPFAGPTVQPGWWYKAACSINTVDQAPMPLGCEASLAERVAEERTDQAAESSEWAYMSAAGSTGRPRIGRFPRGAPVATVTFLSQCVAASAAVQTSIFGAPVECQSPASFVQRGAVSSIAAAVTPNDRELAPVVAGVASLPLPALGSDPLARMHPTVATPEMNFAAYGGPALVVSTAQKLYSGIAVNSATTIALRTEAVGRVMDARAVVADLMRLPEAETLFFTTNAADAFNVVAASFIFEPRHALGLAMQQDLRLAREAAIDTNGAPSAGTAAHVDAVAISLRQFAAERRALAGQPTVIRIFRVSNSYPMVGEAISYWTNRMPWCRAKGGDSTAESHPLIEYEHVTFDLTEQRIADYAAEVAAGGDGSLFAELVAAEIVASRSHVVIIDHISSSPALVWPLREVCRRVKQRAPETFIAVDAAHAIGQLELDFSDDQAPCWGPAAPPAAWPTQRPRCTSTAAEAWTHASDAVSAADDAFITRGFSAAPVDDPVGSAVPRGAAREYRAAQDAAVQHESSQWRLRHESLDAAAMAPPVDGLDANKPPGRVVDFCDVYWTNCHKWLATPKSCAVLYCRSGLLPLLHPTTISNFHRADIELPTAAEYDAQLSAALDVGRCGDARDAADVSAEDRAAAVDAFAAAMGAANAAVQQCVHAALRVAPLGVGIVALRNPHVKGADYRVGGLTMDETRVLEFLWRGTSEPSAWLVVPDGLLWRQWLGGERRIQRYCRRLALDGSAHVAEALGSRLHFDAPGLLSAIVGIRSPASWAPDEGDARSSGLTDEALDAAVGSRRVPLSPAAATGAMHAARNRGAMVADYVFRGQHYIRLSAQVFNTPADFRETGRVLRETFDLAAARAAQAQ